MQYWYLVADGARARLFQTDRLDGDLEETGVYTNEEGRLRDSDFDTDRPGRSFKGGGRRTAMGGENSPSERAEEKFAQSLADRLNRGFHEDKFDRLGIVAAPTTLGRIKNELNDNVKDAIVGTSSKNLTKQSKSDVKNHISENIL